MTPGGATRDRQGVPTADDLSASFRGDVYGEDLQRDPDSFRSHVERNGVDLARSPRWLVHGAFAGMALLAFRGDRAWVGAFGVVPERRGQGLAQQFLEETLDLARASGAASVELEVLTHNPRAIRLYERGGFEIIDELVVWERDALRPPSTTDPTPSLQAYDAAAIAALARTTASCWQREAESVAAAAPFEPLFVGAPDAPDAFAFARRRERASLVDARAHDAAAALALLAALDAQLAMHDLALVNEPARGALHDALTAHHAWREFGRQHRMRIALR